MTSLLEGKKAPAFKLKDKDGSLYALKDFSEDFVVLFFYPKDSTPGCTIEAKKFSSYVSKFKNLNTRIIGISGGDEKSKTKFCDKHNLKITMLSDPDFSIASKYNSFGKKKFMGRTYDGIFRNTFILDSNRKVVKVFEGVKPEPHPEEVLEAIKAIKKGSK